jgi:hypothetical protein
MARERPFPVPTFWSAEEKAALLQRAELKTGGNVSEYIRRAALGRPMRVEANDLAVNALRRAALLVRDVAPRVAEELVIEMERLGGEAE